MSKILIRNYGLPATIALDKTLINSTTSAFYFFVIFYFSWLYCLHLVFFFFFWHAYTRGEGKIRTSDLHFMRRGPQPIELLLENLHLIYCNHNKNMGQRVRKPHGICTYVRGWFRFDFVENDEKYYTKQITKQRIYCIIIAL